MFTGKIAIIGIGHFGKIIALALLRERFVSDANLILSNPSPIDKKDFLSWNIQFTTDNKEAVKNVDVIILAVRPQVIRTVLQEIKDVVSTKQLIISVAAGIEIKTIKKFLGNNQPVVRTMPNLCAKVLASVSCWVKSKEVSKDKSVIAKKILQTFGQEIPLSDEKLLNKITAISGNGPAYFFYLIELLEDTAVKIGIERDLAQKVTLQTFLGTAKLLAHSQQTPKALREEVTSKGGTTEAALSVFNRSGFDKIFMQAIQAAYKRAKELHIKN